MAKSKKNFLIGIYEDEDILLDAIKTIRKNKIKIYEVFTPFPIHGIDDVLGYRRSKLPIAAFCFGTLGCTFGLSMQSFMLGIDWPMNIGGKDFIPLPAFIPVTFECTVLFASFGMVGVFLVVSGLKPWANPTIFDKRSTDDKLVVVIDLSDNVVSQDNIISVLTDSGTSEINKKNFI
jgi:hypothetical protein